MHREWPEVGRLEVSGHGERILYHRELIDLAFAVCDGIASEEQIGRIEEILAADPAARLLYLQCLEMHFDMDRRRRPGTSAGGSSSEDLGLRMSGIRKSAGSPVAVPEPLIAPIIIDAIALPLLSARLSVPSRSAAGCFPTRPPR